MVPTSDEHKDIHVDGNVGPGAAIGPGASVRAENIAGRDVNIHYHASAEPVILQNLRNFTVRIRDPNTDATVGTGVAVSTGGQVVTCAHVVEAALGVHPRDANGAELGVYFPQARGSETKDRRAKVAACFKQHDDDVVLLELVGGPSPLAPEQIAVLGTAENSEDNPFKSYGYRRLDNYHVARTNGTIMGLIEPPLGRQLQADPIQLQSRHISGGMSGAAVLDTERNLVVGLIAERWYSGDSPIDDDIGWGVDAYVLTFDPLNLPVRDAPLPKRPAPQPKTDIGEARAAATPRPGVEMHGAPAPLPEWVGRAEMLRDISADWADDDHRVTGLIGFGGEGKSSLARRWLDGLLADSSQPQPDGVLWWGFYDRPSVDEFFEAALTYMADGRIDPRAIPSANLRVQIIGAMLGAGRYLFVLDGLEIMQHAEGDHYGLLRSNDLAEFLGYFAAPGHESFCLVTSRAPLLGLMDYKTYTHRDVDRLSAGDGRDLLRAVGVRGNAAAFDEVVRDWDGYALILSLLGTLLAEWHDGNVTRVGDIPAPTADEPRYERVHRVLRRYDEHLTEAERAFMTLFSAFRTPVEEAAFERVFRTATDASALNAPLAALDDAAFKAMLKRLLQYRMLRYDERYTAHPMIRNHYFALLNKSKDAQATHESIKDYYLEVAGDVLRFPTLDDLAPLIEVVHHACHAGAYDEAGRIYEERIGQRDRYVLQHQLGAFETTLALMLEFFPDGDTSQEPQVSDPNAKRWILNMVGACLMSLGRLGEALPFYEHANVIQLGLEDWHNASISYRNLAELHAHLGALAASAEAAREALALACRAENKTDEMKSLAYRVWADHLRGDMEAAVEAFGQAEALEREITPQMRYLYSNRGIFHAEHLRRVGDADYARRVTEANLVICERACWQDNWSKSYRVLGDLDADAGQHESARAHYGEALKIARGITDRGVLIEALLARGRWYARHMHSPDAARSDLDEALGYAVDGGYRRYEADIRVGLAWAHLASGDVAAARSEAERARTLSEAMGYHWGVVDTAEVLAAIVRAHAP